MSKADFSLSAILCLCIFPTIGLYVLLVPPVHRDTNGHNQTQMDTHGHNGHKLMHVSIPIGTCDTQTCDTGHVEDDIRSILNNLPENLSLDITMEI